MEFFENGVYEPSFPRSVSLNSCESGQEEPHVEFTDDVELFVGGLEELRVDVRRSARPTPLYHSHVLWSYKLCLGRNPDPSIQCLLYLVSCGPHLFFPDFRDETLNKPKQQQPPKLLRATLTFLGKNKQEGETVEFAIAGDKIIVPGFFSDQKIRAFTVNDMFHARLRLTVDRAYFDLPKIIDLREFTYVKTVRQIMAGERPYGADWTISTPPFIRDGKVVHGAADFHVHKDQFARASSSFSQALSTGRSIPGVIEMVPGENRCILPALSSGEISVVLDVIYGAAPYLPKEISRGAQLCAAISSLFSPRILTEVVLPEWERFMCNAVMSPTMLRAVGGETKRSELLAHFVGLVWACPYGSLPAAKRVLIGALADKLHLDVDGFWGTFMGLMNAFNTAVDADKAKMKNITGALFKHLLRISAVRKRGIRLDYDTNNCQPRSGLAQTLDPADQSPFVIPPTRSLEAAEGDANGDRIEFTRRYGFSVEDSFQSLMLNGLAIQKEHMPLYYGNVLWSYALRFFRAADDSYSFALASVGSHVRSKADPDLNAPRGLREPHVLAATVEIEGSKGTICLKLPSTLIAQERFSKRELLDLAVDGLLWVSARITIGRSYFSLAKIIDLDPKPTVPADRQRTVDTILRGEKPAGSDWQITVSKEKIMEGGRGDFSSGTSAFHVHRSTLTRASSPDLKKLLDSGGSIKDLAVSGKSRCLLSSLTADDMKVVIPLVYGTPIPLPERVERIAPLIRAIGALFKADLLTETLYPQWERAVCVRALAIDKTTTASAPGIIFLLAVVWNCPYGAMPVAKRVAIGVITDMAHLNGNGRLGFPLDALHSGADKVLGEYWGPAKASMVAHVNGVAMVNKRLLAAAAPTRAAPAAAAVAAPTDVVIELPDDDEEEWHDAESIESEKGSKWGCAIA